MKVLIHLSAAKLGPSVGIHLEQAIKHMKNGDKIFFLNCDKSIGGCMENPNWNPLYCKICTYFQKIDMKPLLSKGVEQHWMSEYVKDIKEEDVPCLEYNTVQELRALTYHRVDIGLGVMSIYISQTRNLNPQIDEISRKYFDALIKEQIVITMVFERLQEENNFDYVLVQNGRGPQLKPILNICQHKEIPFLCTEYMRMGDGRGFMNNYQNDIPHSIKGNNDKYNEAWAAAADNLQEREHIARSFFENRRNAKFSGDTIYVKDQEQGKMPVDWDDSKENIVIFNSSEDEFAAVSREFDEASFFESQITGIKTIVEHYKSDSTKHFTLRVHPNLKNVSYKYHTDLYELNYPNLTVIHSKSPISTYSLMDAADKIIVFGSTAGIESTYWGKPVLCLAAAYYNLMDVVYLPKNQEDLWEKIETKDLACKYNDNVLKYGYFYMTDTHQKTDYVDINSYEKIILGKHLMCYKYQKILGSNFLYALFMGLYLRFLINKWPAKFHSLPWLEQL